MPLNNIPLVYPARDTFDVLIQVTSFDFLPGEVIEAMEFTPTDYWSPEFEWLGYDSTNFIEQMGSISIFAGILLIQVIICPLWALWEKKAPGTEACCTRFKCGWFRDKFQPMTVALGAELFLLETYMELVISVALGTRNWEIREIWQPQDKVAVVCHMFTAICVVGFTIFISWFTFKKINELVIVRKAEYDEEKAGFIEEVREEYKAKTLGAFEKRRNTMDGERDAIIRQFAIATEKAKRQSDNLQIAAAKVDEEEFEWYEPLYEGLDLKKDGAQYHNFIFIMRRTALVFLALFCRDWPWIQMLCFLALSLG